MQATTQTTAQQSPSIDLSEDTLRGDIRDVILTLLRQMPGWDKLSEAEQRWRIEVADKASQKVVRQSIQIVANRGFPHLAMRTGKWSVTDGIKLELTGAASVENITRLAEHGAGECIVSLVEVGEYFGERQAARAQPDQPGLPIDGDDEGEGDGEPLAEADREFTREAAPQTTRSRRRSTIRENEPA